MSFRIASASILRSALAAHAGLSATSLLRSTLGPPSMPPPLLSSSSSSSSAAAAAEMTPVSDDPPRRRRRHSRPRPDSHRLGAEEATAGARGALPWLDRLHAVVTDLYASGGGGGAGEWTDDRGRAGGGRPASSGGLRREYDDDDVDVATVRLGRDVSFEDPIVRHMGDAEVGRAFRGRLRARPWRDVETVLECVGVEASDDGICGGAAMRGGGRDARHRHPLLGIISPEDPPRVVVTYRLSQRYGLSRLTVDSLLLVTVQVRSRGCSEQLRWIARNGKIGAVPLATSSLAPRAASSAAAAAAAAAHPGVATLALLARAANDVVAAATTTARGGAPHCRPSEDFRLAWRGSTPLVAEVVGMEERWNGVVLIDYAPFRWSRRLNGLIFVCASYFFCD